MSEGITWTVYDADTMTQAEIYGQVLCDLGKINPQIVGLSADLAKSTKIGRFQDHFPERFFNGPPSRSGPISATRTWTSKSSPPTAVLLSVRPGPPITAPKISPSCGLSPT